ncbi:MAG: helix-hairpin-helix domain-containing protein [Lutibacter sp.]|nr:helix-hairpin-helix domain-containing protein [Lutibacter sp.]MDT8417608.1 helix-hairpin-helix domain-containing protein [Lutibacter sp.]
MKLIKSHFRYTKSQRNGIFFLLIFIVFLQGIFFFVDFSSQDNTAVSQTEITAFQQEMDSLKNVASAKNIPKIYPFNPNFISDFKGHQLGMSTDEIDKLLAFRAQGKFINSTKQFQEITGVNDSLLAVISPHFKFPDWITSGKTIGKQYSNSKIGKSIVKKDINAASAEDLIIVNGIGEKLAKRIIDYRTKLQGFSFNDQIFEVWALDKEVADKVLQYFEVKKPLTIQKINVNTATFKEVLAIVYLDYELTKKIFNYKNQVAEIQSIEELKKIDGFPREKFSRIALYLEAK